MVLILFQNRNGRDKNTIAGSLYECIHTIFFLQWRHSQKMKAKLKHFTFYSLVKFSLYLWSRTVSYSAKHVSRSIASSLKALKVSQHSGSLWSCAAASKQLMYCYFTTLCQSCFPSNKNLTSFTVWQPVACYEKKKKIHKPDGGNTE